MRRLCLLFILIPTLAQAHRLIDRCGVYLAEGYYTEIRSHFHQGKKKRVILLDRGSNSEIKFFVMNQDMSKLIPDTYLGVNLKLKLKFVSSCWHHCEGEVIEILEAIDPFEVPKSFLFPKPNPIRGTNIPCKPNSFEDGDDVRS